MARHLLVLLTLSLLAATTARAAPTRAAAAQQSLAAEQAPLRLLVRLKSGSPLVRESREVQARELRAWAEQRGLAVRDAHGLGGRLNALTLDEATGSRAEAARLAADLATDPEVEYAEVDQRRFAHAVPTDALYAEQWYLQDQQAGASNFQAAWDISGGATDTVIAVLDTGVLFDHPDLGRDGQGGRLLAGYDFVDADNAAGTSFVAANDGNGWDPDPSDPGDWVTAEEDAAGPLRGCLSPDLTFEPSSWHGTRVIGMIAAVTNNGLGVAGGTWSSRVLPVRVLGKCGGYDSDIIAGMRWAAGLRVQGVPTNPNPAQIINLSLGSSGSCSRAYRDAIAELQSVGVLVVASAGNEDGKPVDSPANCPGVLAVAGLRHIGTKVGYSNQGPEVGIAAPAGNCPIGQPYQCGGFSLVTTTDTGETTPAGPTYTSDGDYWPNVGTSFSAPIVAAIAGLMHGANPALDVTTVIARMQAGARPFAQDPAIPTCPNLAPQTSQCNCTTTTCGAGIADALGAVTEALRPIARLVQPAGTTVGEDVTLDATGSAAARGRSLTRYDWSVVSGAASFVGPADGDTAVIAAPTAGLSTVRLTVTDDNGATDSAEVTLETMAASSSSGGGGGGGALDPLLLAGLVLLGRRRPTQL